MVAFLTSQNYISTRNVQLQHFTKGLKRQQCCAHKTVNVPCATASNQIKTERRSLSRVNITPFDSTVADKAETEHPLTRRAARTLQINIGLTCNLACRHCHVESSPSRTETMPHFVAKRLIELAAADSSLEAVDITGGAPELHSEFRFLVETFSRQGLSIIDRCNLAVLLEPDQHDLVSFLARHQVHVIASMPCYSATNVEAQRGDGAFDASIRALHMLNEAGYGRLGSSLRLDLVYNPIGPTLPPPQLALEADYRRELKRAFDIDFSSLICITNMPIKRFADDLLIRGKLDDYMSLLVNSFNPSTVENVMCRDQVHVAWNGLLYDCDFNYALDMALPGPKSHESSHRKPLSIFDIQSFSELDNRRIATGKHCYGCTAGSGSSCGGSLT